MNSKLRTLIKSFKKKFLKYISVNNYFLLKNIYKSNLKIIVDFNHKNSFKYKKTQTASYDTSISRESLTRDYLFNDLVFDEKLKFLEIGSGKGELNYLLGHIKNQISNPDFYNKNLKKFNDKFQYYGLDIRDRGGDKKIIIADICDDNLNNLIELNKLPKFDVVYSNNVFEHLNKPWVAAKNIIKLSKIGTSIIIKTPFSQRYHPSPDDYFRFTHKGLIELFKEYCVLKIINSGYDITGRRNDWQGKEDSFVPEDNFGAWRENWFSVLIAKVEKIF